MAILSKSKVRRLGPQELGVQLPTPKPGQTGPAALPGPAQPSPSDIPEIDQDDPVLLTVEDLLTTYGGVLFTGPPGTSKSYYAEQVALTLAGHSDRVRTVQFHPSYQYEDFMEGYVATPSGYQIKPKHFLDVCYAAEIDPGHRYFLVIDELSRSDPGRVFGEALTYIERTKRGKTFRLSSGRELVVPDNLEILATMNPLDRGVDEVDAALNRRFAKYAMEPNYSVLDQFLRDAGMDDTLREGVVRFFRKVNQIADSGSNAHAALGQTYFLGVKDAAGLNRLWEHQLRFHFEQAYRLDEDGLAQVRDAWNRVVTAPAAAPSVQTSATAPAAASDPAPKPADAPQPEPLQMGNDVPAPPLPPRPSPSPPGVTPQPSASTPPPSGPVVQPPPPTVT
jgi:5-methylcytosine-specific restriction protein B